MKREKGGEREGGERKREIVEKKLRRLYYT